MTKSNMMKARNDMIDSVNLTLTTQKDNIADKRQIVGKLEEQPKIVVIYKRHRIKSEVS